MKHKHNPLRILLLAALPVLSTTALAATPVSPSLEFTGNDAVRLAADAVPVKRISSTGHDVPLVDALKVILPADWKASIDSYVDLGTPLSWSAKNANWSCPLTDAATKAGLRIRFDPDHRTVILTNGYDL